MPIHIKLLHFMLFYSMVKNNLVSVSQAAKQFDVTNQTIRQWIKDGYMAAIQLPNGRYKINQSEVDRLLSREVKNGD